MRNCAAMIAIISLIGLSMIACSEKIEPGNTPQEKGPPIPVTVQSIRIAVHPVMVEAVGTVKAKVSATVSSKLMGVIQSFNVKEGDTVAQGDLLVVLDERQAVAQLNQAQAALAEARKAEAAAVSARESAVAGARRAQLAFQRSRKMLEGQAITQETFETVEAQHKQAQAALEQSEAMVEAAKYRVNQARAAVDSAILARKDARILAPFDAEVTAKLADAGSLAVPGTPLLTLERASGFRVDLVVPESHIQSIRTGQAVDVRIPAIGENSIAGKVDVIVPSADQGSRTFVVQVGLAQTPGLRSGMFARVPLSIGERQMLRIPASAVIRQGQLTGVFIVDEANIARFRLVRIGRSYGDEVEVISGVRDGARVVVAPTPKLSNGSVVEPAS